MSKHIIYSALALCLIASCKKSDEKKLIGKWRGVSDAGDENQNGVLDAQEQQNGTSSGTDPYWGFTFKKGGDAEITELGTVAGKWELKNNGQTLKISGGGVMEFKVLTLTNTDMTLEYTEDADPNSEKSWFVLEKQ